MRRLRFSALVVPLALLASLGVAPLARVAHAQTDSRGTAKVAAETLFEEGRRLMADGKTADACPKFAESQRLDPSPSTLLNLASCYEKSDRPATAWVTYREAASSSLAAGRQDLVATAQRHADALVAALARVNLTVSAPVDGIDVKIDGVSVGRAQWGIALPVDPGEHTVEATAPLFKPWSTKVTVAHDPATIPVVVPALEAAPAPPPPPVETAPPPVTPVSAPPPADAHRGRGQRTAGLLVGAAGVVGLGLSAAFAVVAKSKYNDSLTQCPASPDRCTPAGVNERGNARTMGDIASVAVAVGSVAVVGGVVLWLSAPSPGAPPSQAARIELGPLLGGGVGGGMVSGRW